MSQYHQILILPVIALALVVLFPLFGKELSMPNSWKSKRRRRIITGRIAVISLLIGTVVTELFPIEGLNIVVQGLLVAALVMIPSCIIYWFIARRHSDNQEELAPLKLKRKTDYAPSYADSETATASGARKKKSRSHSTSGTSSRSKQWAEEESVDISLPQAPDLTLFDRDAEDDDTGVEYEVQEQMARVSRVVRSHDLEDSGYVSPDTDDNNRTARGSRDQRVAANNAMMTHAEQTTDISNLNDEQIGQLVSSLTKDKNRLQKLVIAQQASIESERQAHDQTRTLTRDAIKVMRSARTAQKQAEKMARRERAERQRVEQQYKKVASALRNAMSIMEKRKAKADTNETIPTLRTSKIASKA